ncbi:hypothetical protein EDD15DRAFT_2305646, partial [Pisolithus albus]
MEIPPGASTHVISARPHWLLLPSASLPFHWLLCMLLSDVVCCVVLMRSRKSTNSLRPPRDPPSSTMNLSVCVCIAALHRHFVEVQLPHQCNTHLRPSHFLQLHSTQIGLDH